VTEPEPGDDPLLGELAEIAAQLDAAEQLAVALRDWRDRVILMLADRHVPLAAIGERADLSVKGVSKVTRAAGFSRYRPRGEPAPVTEKRPRGRPPGSGAARPPAPAQVSPP